MLYNTTFTKKHKTFFKKPRTMQEVTELFKGDAWEANSFQSVNLIGRNIKMIDVNGKVHLVNYDYKETV